MKPKCQVIHPQGGRSDSNHHLAAGPVANRRGLGWGQGFRLEIVNLVSAHRGTCVGKGNPLLQKQPL